MQWKEMAGVLARGPATQEGLTMEMAQQRDQNGD
jgi:hypothetical protein